MCGIGGRTIAEAKERLSYSEFLGWAAYRNKRGSLHIGYHVEGSLAILSTMFANANTKNGGYKFYDFAPHHEEPPITLEQAMREWF